MSNLKSNLVTAISTSGNLTIAHYLFVIKPLLKIKNNFNLFFSIADLHAITNEHIPEKLIKLRKETVNYLFACGFNAGEIFIQSQISGHSKMTFILGCHVNIGKLLTMTQFKSKSKHNIQTLALLNYPLLMASDILLYEADVLVANDQKQHIELTRDLAEKINKKFQKKIFHLPNLITNDVFPYRVRDLQKNTEKMSKSSTNSKGIIFLNDTPDVIRNKIIISKTDSENKIFFDFETKPGISNLILLFALSKDLSIDQATKILQETCQDYFVLKNKVASTIIEVVTPIQIAFQKLKQNPDLVNDYLNRGRQRAQKQVNLKFNEIQKYLGFDFQIKN